MRTAEVRAKGRGADSGGESEAAMPQASRAARQWSRQRRGLAEGVVRAKRQKVVAKEPTL